MKHREDLFPHSNSHSESYLISVTLLSVLEIALTLCSSLPLSFCSAFKEKTPKFLINNVPGEKKRIIPSFFLSFFVLSLAVLLDRWIPVPAARHPFRALTLPQLGQQHSNTVMIIWMNGHKDIQLHIYCTALCYSRINEWLIVLS